MSYAPMDSRGLWQLVERVCRRVPPSFQLADFVAVSPFVGYAEMPFLEAHAAMERRLHADLLPDIDTFRASFARRSFDATDVRAAVDAWDRSRAERPGAPRVDASVILRWLDGTLGVHALAEPPRRPEVLSIAERIDRAEGTGLRDAIVEDIARLCAELNDRGVARIASPVRGCGLYEAFLRTARYDRTMASLGVNGFAAVVEELPTDVAAAFEQLLGTTNLGNVPVEDYLGRLLSEVKGWAGALRAMSFSRDPMDVGRVPELLLVRLVHDVALSRSERIGVHAVPRVPRIYPGSEAAEPRVDVVARYVLLDAAERGLRRTLAKRLASSDHVERMLRERERPLVQAVFCIDVRSEPLRRALEAATSSAETYGFAGFFGMPIAIRTADRHDAQPQCPVLLEPAITIHPGDAARAPTSRGNLGAMLADMRHATFGGFTYVETLGLGAVGSMVRETLGLVRGPRPEAETAPIDHRQLGEEAGLDLAASALKNLGLRAPYGRLVLLVAHDATSANDPLRAGLSCGACAGHGGAPNARLLASLLNDPRLRDGLRKRGFRLPDDCLVLAAVHDTTTDVVRLLDRSRVPPTHRDDVQVLDAMLQVATRTTREVRARELPGLESTRSPEELSRKLDARAHDWAEVRPEWALAGNAAFIAARRERTRGVDLGGRVFLHSYDRALDPDGSVLRLLLNAPVVVASFINLQYYGSTVAKDALGSGTKALHNVSGGVGVVLGNGGDLSTGLSLQSVTDGERDRHEPLRLQVIVEDTEERIAAVLDASPVLASMVAHEYLMLFSLDPEGERVVRVRSGASRASAAASPAVHAGGAM